MLRIWLLSQTIHTRYFPSSIHYILWLFLILITNHSDDTFLASSILNQQILSILLLLRENPKYLAQAFITEMEKHSVGEKDTRRVAKVVVVSLFRYHFIVFLIQKQQNLAGMRIFADLLPKLYHSIINIDVVSLHARNICFWNLSR